MTGLVAAPAAARVLNIKTRRTSLETWELHLAIVSSAKTVATVGRMGADGSVTRPAVASVCGVRFVPLGPELIGMTGMLAVPVQHQQQLVFKNNKTNRQVTAKNGQNVVAGKTVTAGERIRG